MKFVAPIPFVLVSIVLFGYSLARILESFGEGHLLKVSAVVIPIAFVISIALVISAYKFRAITYILSALTYLLLVFDFFSGVVPISLITGTSPKYFKIVPTESMVPIFTLSNLLIFSAVCYLIGNLIVYRAKNA